MLKKLADRAHGLARLNDFVLSGGAGLGYTRDRNVDYGPGESLRVSGLSPWLRSRLILETEVLGAVLAKEGTQRAEKFIQEVCWRTYWKGWLELHPAVWQQYLLDRNRLHLEPPRSIEKAYAGCTGIECFDSWAKELVQTGYLHNHTRMWVASIWIFTLKLPWQLGAAWFMQHLVDADAASNTLSWRWVAGLHTPGKHYLARAENIARYTQGRFDPKGQLDESATALQEVFSQPESPLDTDYQQVVVTRASSLAPVLVLHDDDLFPESLSLLSNGVSGIIVVPTQPHSQNSLPKAPQAAFICAGMDDAVARCSEYWGLSQEHILNCNEPAELDQIWQQHSIFSFAPLVHAYLPVGPSRDALAAPLLNVIASGGTVSAICREWDTAAWPFAQRGFFQFRQRIPALLKSLVAPRLI